MSTLFVYCRALRERQYAGIKTKIRVGGQKLQTETPLFEFSKLVTLLRLFLIATESYEGSKCTVREQYLEFFNFKTTKQLSQNYMNFMPFLVTFLILSPAIDSSVISKKCIRAETFPHPDPRICSPNN